MIEILTDKWIALRLLFIKFKTIKAKKTMTLSAVELELAFEHYDTAYQMKIWNENQPPSRYYKPGRVYGSPGEYGNKEKEERYQKFISNPELVLETWYDYKECAAAPIPAEYDFDVIQSRPNNHIAVAAAAGANICDDYGFDNYMASIRFEGEYSDDESDEDDEDEHVETMCIPSRPTEIEEGEIVEPDVYPNDLLEPEPFIRAPVVSYDAADNEFPETYLGTQSRASLWNRMVEEEKQEYTIWDIQDQEREDYEAYLLEMAEQAEMDYDDI